MLRVPHGNRKRSTHVMEFISVLERLIRYSVTALGSISRRCVRSSSQLTARLAKSLLAPASKAPSPRNNESPVTTILAGAWLSFECILAAISGISPSFSIVFCTLIFTTFY